MLRLLLFPINILGDFITLVFRGLGHLAVWFLRMNERFHWEYLPTHPGRAVLLIVLAFAIIIKLGFVIYGRFGGTGLTIYCFLMGFPVLWFFMEANCYAGRGVPPDVW